MRFKILLLISPLLVLTTTLFAKPFFDSVGVENQNGKKIILHKVEPKDTYYGVGRRYDVKPNLIIQFNNNLILHPGAVIKVPTELPFAETTAKPAHQAVANKPEEKTSVQQFKVSAGETLYSIAKRFNTTVDAIKADNGLKSDVLSPGETLTIRTSGTPAKAVEKEKEVVTETKPVPPPVVQQRPQVQQPVVTPPVQNTPRQPQTPVSTNTQTPVNTQNTQQYKVSNGETLYTIAKRFGTSVDDIIALNKLSGNSINPGEILVVRSGMPPAPKQDIIARRDTTMVATADSTDRHLPANRYGLFLKEEKGAATWMDDTSFDPKKQLVLHRTAPIGTVMKITNPMTNRSIFAKVAGRFTDNEQTKDVIVVVTKNVADLLGVMDKRFRVNISYGVPTNDQ
jgi:LysM repeat protein